ncbi:cellulose synthase subunit BcsC-related outer membrane protein [Undibacterium sp. SXout7W]|uniref:cellulose synthase subunit BcsC-related outer membrane protein n=1 Tax=Undibacterium sp. SXout7W TaxID=3413049 RepID=UPI003BEFD57B
MVLKKKAIAVALLSMYFDSGVALANSPLNQKLIEQAQFWTQRGRPDNAADAWRKLLNVDPGSVDALVALTVHEARSGNAELAKGYLAKLRQVAPNNPQIKVAEEAIRRGTSGGNAQLDDARRLAKQGDAEAAVESYKLMGDPSKLKGDAAYEYYQVLAGTVAGYPESRRGLERLTKENPSNTKYALALAQVLTYRENTRLEGLAMLESLSNKADVGKQATDAWRQTLTWMGGKNVNTKYFHAYLEKFPNDKAIQDRLANLTRPAPVAAASAAPEEKKAPPKPRPENPVVKTQSAGYKALEADDLKTAESEFQSLIKTHPKDPAGHGGMGLVKMRQEAFIDARTFFQKALDLASTKGKDEWKKLYVESNYWATLEEARTAFEDSDSVKGIEFLRKAVSLNGQEAVGILQLADALKAENDFPGAEENYRLVLKSNRKNQGALDGLMSILVLQKRLKDLEELTPDMSARQLTIVADLKANDLQEKAKVAETAGDIPTAQRLLEDAILITPENPWLRMALAKIYLKRDMPGQARSLLDALTNVEAPSAEALYVSASLSAIQQFWWEGLMTLERIPVAARKPVMFELQKRLWIRVQLDRMNFLIQRGNPDAARQILAATEAAAGYEPEFIGTIAAMEIKIGDPERGYGLIRQAVQNTPQPSAGLLLQYASTLLRANQEAELEAVMRKIAAMPNLQPEEIADFKNLQRVLSMRYSERAREAGDYAASYNYLQPMLMADPDDNLVLLALARIYTSAGDTDSAKELFNKVLQSEPENPEVLQGLVYASIQAKDFSGAETYLATLMRLQPDNPRFIALAGNVARAQGNNGKALGYFKQALALEQAQHPVNGMGANGLRLVAQAPVSALADFRVNPFADRKGAAPAANVVRAQVPALKEVPATNAGFNSALPSLPQTNTAAPQRMLPVVPQLPAVPTSVPASVPGSVPPPVPSSAPAPAPATLFTAPGGQVNVPVRPVSNVPAAAISPSVSSAGGSGASTVVAVMPYVPPVARPLPEVNKANYSSAPASSYTSTNSTAGSLRQAQATTGSTSRNQPNQLNQPYVTQEEAALAKEIESLNELNRSQVTAEFSTRVRSGEKGLSQLKDLEMPMEVQVSTLGMGQFGLKIIPVVLDAGTMYLNDPSISGQFGRNAILVERAKFSKVPFTTIARQQGLSTVAALEQDAKGMALNLSYEIAGVKADIGSSPIGFPIQNVVGGLRWSTQSDGANFGAELVRRSVTDSYLSYAGTKDSIYGLTWGGVAKTGVHLDTSYDGDEGGVYASTGYYSLTGKNVAKNTMFELGAGAYWRAYRGKDTLVTTGLGLTTMFYNRNLRYFTYGHGGYFSPKSYLALGIPLEVSGRLGRFSYQVATSIGVQHFREEAAPYYPNSSADQAELEVFAAANPTLAIQTNYPGQSRTGVQYRLAGAAEYQLTPQLSLGGRISADNSGDFTDAAGLLYLRYTFEPRKSAVAFPPVAPKPYYLGN